MAFLYKQSDGAYFHNHPTLTVITRYFSVFFLLREVILEYLNDWNWSFLKSGPKFKKISCRLSNWNFPKIFDRCHCHTGTHTHKTMFVSLLVGLGVFHILTSKAVILLSQKFSVLGTFLSKRGENRSSSCQLFVCQWVGLWESLN